MKILYKNLGLVLLLILSLFLTLYLTGPKLLETRSLHKLWDTGHIALFFIVSGFILVYRRNQLATLKSEYLWALIYPLVFGLAIEVIQPLVGRTAALSDIAKNFTGSLLAFSFFRNTCSHTTNSYAG